MKTEQFDFEAFKPIAKERLKAGKGLPGSEGVFSPLMKRILEEALENELEVHINSVEGNTK